MVNEEWLMVDGKWLMQAVCQVKTVMFMERMACPSVFFLCLSLTISAEGGSAYGGNH